MLCRPATSIQPGSDHEVPASLAAHWVCRVVCRLRGPGGNLPEFRALPSEKPPQSSRQIRPSASPIKPTPRKAESPSDGPKSATPSTSSKSKTSATQIGTNVEIWVNKSYVVWLPELKARPGKITAIPFQAIYNEDGHSFPTDNRKTLINLVEVYHDGKMFEVKSQLAD